MKKIFFILLLVPLLFASDIKIEQKIYGLIIHAPLPQKAEVKVWVDNPSRKEIFRLIQGVRCVENPNDADFLLLSKRESRKT